MQVALTSYNEWVHDCQLERHNGSASSMVYFTGQEYSEERFPAAGDPHLARLRLSDDGTEPKAKPSRGPHHSRSGRGKKIADRRMLQFRLSRCLHRLLLRPFPASA